MNENAVAANIAQTFYDSMAAAPYVHKTDKGREQALWE